MWAFLTQKKQQAWGSAAHVRMVSLAGLANAEGDTSLGHIVGRYFDAYLVTYDEADEAFAHFARDVGKEFVTVGNLDAEHGTCENGGDDAFHFDFAFAIVPLFDAWTSEGIAILTGVAVIPVAILRFCTAIRWFCHLIQLLLRLRAWVARLRERILILACLDSKENF